MFIISYHFVKTLHYILLYFLFVSPEKVSRPKKLYIFNSLSIHFPHSFLRRHFYCSNSMFFRSMFCQNCSKTYFMNILRIFDDHHMWHQNWPLYVWNTLSQAFMVKYLCGQAVWFFDTWHIYAIWQESKVFHLVVDVFSEFSEYISTMITMYKDETCANIQK